MFHERNDVLTLPILEVQVAIIMPVHPHMKGWHLITDYFPNIGRKKNIQWSKEGFSETEVCLLSKVSSVL